MNDTNYKYKVGVRVKIKRGLKLLAKGRFKKIIIGLVLTPIQKDQIRFPKRHSCDFAKPSTTLEKYACDQYIESHEHMMFLYFLVTNKKMTRMVEIGTRYAAGSTLSFLYAAKEMNGHLTSIDNDEDGGLEVARKRVSDLDLNKYWTLLEGDSLGIEYNDPIDSMFIDGLHTYDQVSGELAKYEPLVVPDGIITLHDIVLYPEVEDAIKDYIKERDDLRYYRFFHGFGLGVIVKS